MGNKKPEGIGGWLLIPTFAFIVTAIVFIYLSIWFLIDLSVGYGYDETAFLIFCIFAFLSCCYTYTLILEFRKKKSFPKLAIALLSIGYVSILLMELVVDGTISNYFSGIIGASLWTWYFIKSKRVKNTFAN